MVKSTKQIEKNNNNTMSIAVSNICKLTGASTRHY